MSNTKERLEKICLNCNAELNGRFCHLCGQENVEPKQSAWSLITHFFYDITHFDGKFFSTVKQLIRKPGFLSKEYMLGRRAAYLNPIRMYVFTSAFFFIIFFSLFSAKNMNIGSNSFKIDSTDAVWNRKEAIADSALSKAKTKEDSIAIGKVLDAMGVPAKRTAQKDSISRTGPIKFSLSKNDYNTKQEYDSVQRSLPPNKRDGWFSRLMTYRVIELNREYNENPAQLFRNFVDTFIHTFPYLLFVSLPLFALFLKLLYIRRKQFYYVDHGIFLVHLYIFTFLVLLIFFALVRLDDAIGLKWKGIVQFILIMYGMYYALRAMKNFYSQGWGKTIFKFILFNMLTSVSMILLFAFFLVITVFRV